MRYLHLHHVVLCRKIDFVEEELIFLEQENVDEVEEEWGGCQHRYLQVGELTQ